MDIWLMQDSHQISNQHVAMPPFWLGEGSGVALPRPSRRIRPGTPWTPTADTLTSGP